MSENDDKGSPQRKRRTREHVIEDLSENHPERVVLLKGHLLRRPERDYGVDVTMFHFGDDGTVENGEVRFQLKATDELKRINRGTVVSLTIKTRDLHYWSLEIYPFILVVFDAQAEKAFWLHIQEYVERHPDCMNPDQESVNLHIPVSNELTVQSIEDFRGLSLQVVQHIRNQGGSSDAPRKPK